MNIDKAVFKYLDLSTGHLPPNEMHALLEHKRVVAHGHEYGAWVWVPPDDCDDVHDVREELPALAAIFVVARTLDCRWINFDSDGDIVDGLQVFAW